MGTIKDDLNSNDVTDDPQPILHGTAEAGSTVNIYTVDATRNNALVTHADPAFGADEVNLIGIHTAQRSNVNAVGITRSGCGY